MNADPTEEDIYTPEFDAIWQAIKGWDISRAPEEDGHRLYAGATGTDVMTILNALKSVPKPESVISERIFDWTTATPIESAVFEAIGAASVCWESMEGTGVFDSTRAKKIGDELVEYFRSKGPIY